MQGWFIFAIIFALFGVGAYAASWFFPSGEKLEARAKERNADPYRRNLEDDPLYIRGILHMISIGLGVAFLLFSIIASFNVVSTRNVGIITTFGRPVDTHGNGLAWIWPWQKISELSEAIQLQSFQGNNYDDPQNSVKVRLANNSSAFVELNLNWRLRQGSAAQLFKDYLTFDNIRENLVDKQAQVALSKEFATFNPQLATPSLDPNQPQVQMTPAQGADLPKMAENVKRDLQNAVGNDIEIIDVRIPGIFYDKATQDRIDAFNQKVQETKNAQQDVQTAIQNKNAAQERAAQVPPDLRIAVFNCLNDQVKQGRDPAGCWGQIGGNPLIQIPKP